MSFETPLDLRAYMPGEWLLLSPLRYLSTSGRRYVVPSSFITDLASIPRLLRGVFDQNGRSRPAAVLHDYLYCARLTSRAEADGLFLEALESVGMPWAVRRSMWAGVRMGGWIYWNKRSDGLNHEDFHQRGDV